MTSSSFPGSEHVYYPVWEEDPLLGAVGDQGVGQGKNTFPSPVGAGQSVVWDSAEAVGGEPMPACGRAVPSPA